MSKKKPCNPFILVLLLLICSLFFLLVKVEVWWIPISYFRFYLFLPCSLSPTLFWRGWWHMGTPSVHPFCFSFISVMLNHPYFSLFGPERRKVEWTCRQKLCGILPSTVFRQGRGEGAIFPCSVDYKISLHFLLI